MTLLLDSVAKKEIARELGYRPTFFSAHAALAHVIRIQQRPLYDARELTAIARWGWGIVGRFPEWPIRSTPLNVNPIGRTFSGEAFPGVHCEPRVYYPGDKPR